MRLPKQVGALSRDQPVVRVFSAAFAEWWSLGQHHKNDDASSKDIYLRALIWLFKMNLWRHVALRSELRLELALAIAPSDRSRKAKVCNLQVVVLVKHEVLGLQVPMADALLVHEVERLEHLHTIETCDWLTEGAAKADEVEELSTRHKFEDQVLHLFALILFRIDRHTCSVLNHVNDSRVFQSLQGFDFS